MIDQGARAINFELPSSMGRIVNLQNYLGKYIVLFFLSKKMVHQDVLKRSVRFEIVLRNF